MNGLANLGNTCGVNAWVQCVSHCLTLRRAFEQSMVDAGNAPDAPIAREWHALSQHMTTADARIILPKGFMQALYAVLPWVVVPMEPTDLVELWMGLTNALGRELHMPRHVSLQGQNATFRHPDPELHRYFTQKAGDAWKQQIEHDQNAAWSDATTGLLFHQTVCETCKHHYHNAEAFSVLPLPLERGDVPVDLRFLFRRLFDPEALNADGQNDWKCDHCKSYEPATRVLRIWRAPPVLVLALKRFEWHGGGLHKIRTPVSVPPVLGWDAAFEMNPWATGQVPTEYTLVSMGKHSGSTQGGHYTAVGLHPDTQQWHSYDDNVVGTVPAPVSSSTHPEWRANTHAYVLVYERGQASPLPPALGV